MSNNSSTNIISKPQKCNQLHPLAIKSYKLFETCICEYFLVLLQLMITASDSCNLLSLTAFQNKYGIKVQPLTFFGITSAVNRFRSSITRTHNKYESFLSKLLNTQKPSRLAYQKRVSKKVTIQFHVKKNGRRIQLQTLMKVLIGKRLTKYPLNVPRALNLLISISNFCADA